MEGIGETEKSIGDTGTCIGETGKSIGETRRASEGRQATAKASLIVHAGRGELNEMTDDDGDYGLICSRDAVGGTPTGSHNSRQNHGQHSERDD